MRRSFTRVAAGVSPLAVAAFVLGFPLAACVAQDDSDLWGRKFSGSAPSPAGGGVTGYWEGRVFAGGIRLKIENASIAAALKCDVHGETVTSQGSAPIVFVADGRPRMVLQADLKGDRKGCGFLFAKGSEFAYALNERGMLRIGFAGTGTSELAKLADLPAGG
jgi:hypothetical protein